MFEFIIVHKFCGYTKTVRGANIWDALRQNNLDYTVWMVRYCKYVIE